MAGKILTPGEGDGLLYGPDGKSKVRAPATGRARRKAASKLCGRCGKNPKAKKLPNGLRVCWTCYAKANPLGAARLIALRAEIEAAEAEAKAREARRA